MKHRCRTSDRRGRGREGGLRTGQTGKSTVHGRFRLAWTRGAVPVPVPAMFFLFMENLDSDVGNGRATPPAPFSSPPGPRPPPSLLPGNGAPPLPHSAPVHPLLSLHYTSPRFRTISAQPRASTPRNLPSTATTNRIPHAAPRLLAAVARRARIAFFWKEGTRV